MPNLRSISISLVMLLGLFAGLFAPKEAAAVESDCPAGNWSGNWDGQHLAYLEVTCKDGKTNWNYHYVPGNMKWKDVSSGSLMASGPISFVRSADGKIRGCFSSRASNGGVHLSTIVMDSKDAITPPAKSTDVTGAWKGNWANRPDWWSNVTVTKNSDDKVLVEYSFTTIKLEVEEQKLYASNAFFQNRIRGMFTLGIDGRLYGCRAYESNGKIGLNWVAMDRQ